VNDIAMHYQLVGDPTADPSGAPVMLVHGFTSSGNEFDGITPTLASRTLIMPDMIGFGHSQRLSEPSPAYSHRGQATQLAGLLDQLGVQQVDLIGSSYGGAVAAQFALDYPERVRRIVFLDAQIYDQSGGPGSFTALLPFGLNRALAWFVLGGGDGARALMQSACPNPATPCVDPKALAIRERIASIKRNTDALLAFTAPPRDVRVPRDLGAIRAPALVIWGEDDQLVPLADGRQLAADVPGARFEVIADAGHTPHIERPAEVGSMIQAFLTSGP
jgi:3-oxoadipate enol-lactonase